MYVSYSNLEAVFSVLVLSLHGLGQSLVLQVAKKASVLKRRKSKNRMEPPGTPQGDAPTPSPCDTSSDVVYYIEEPKAGEFQHSELRKNIIHDKSITRLYCKFYYRHSE